MIEEFILKGQAYYQNYQNGMLTCSLLCHCKNEVLIEGVMIEAFTSKGKAYYPT